MSGGVVYHVCRTAGAGKTLGQETGWCRMTAWAGRLGDATGNDGRKEEVG